MFVAKFSQANGDVFVADKNGNKPFIGEVLSGTAKGTLINGTMFKREGLQPNKLYACENIFEDYEGTPQVRVQVIAEVSVLDYMELRTKLGAGVLNRGEAVETAEEVAEEIKAE